MTTATWPPETGRRPVWKRAAIGAGIGAAAALIGSLAWAGLTTPTAREDAERVCQQFVRANTATGRTARFHGHTEILRQTGREWWVRGDLSAANTFGARTNGSYDCWVRLSSDGTSWQLVDLIVD